MVTELNTETADFCISSWPINELGFPPCSLGSGPSTVKVKFLFSTYYTKNNCCVIYNTYLYTFVVFFSFGICIEIDLTKRGGEMVDDAADGQT